MNSSRILLWLVAIGFFMETLDATIVNTALPAMAKSLGESPLTMQSVVIAYSLTLAVLIPASGWLADRFGTRKTFFSAIFLFTLGSLLCATSHNLLQLTLSRVLQGLGGSMLMPVGRLAVLSAFPGERFLEAMSFVTIPALIGPLIGPTLGGWLVQFASWHWIFLVNIPIGIIGCITTYLIMPDDRRENRSKFDFEGFFLLSFSMVSISFGLDGLAELGFKGATATVLIIFGLACLASYWIRAAKKKDPLFPPDLFKNSTYTLGLMGNFFSRLGSSGMPFLIPLLLQVGLHYTPLEAGLTMVPVAIAAIVAKKLARPLITRVGYRNFLITNTFVVGFCIGSFFWFSVEVPQALRFIQLLIFGCANSLQFTGMNSLTLKDLDRSKASSGNSLFSMIQMLAMSFGVAICGVILSTFTSYFQTPGDPSGQLQAFHSTFLCMGIITCASVWIFWQLTPNTRAPNARTKEKKPIVLENHSP
jgi:EmrB/QacA subfamily drug resistance transporter